MNTLEVIEQPQIQVVSTDDRVVLRDVGRGEAIYLGKPAVGEGLDQGDTMLQYLGAHLGERCIGQFDIIMRTNRVVTEDIQVTDGSGIGSRHVVKAHPKLRTVDNVNQFPLVGRFFFVEEGGELRQEHPEHATIVFDQPGWYVSRFQRAPALGGEDRGGVSRTQAYERYNTRVLTREEYYRRYE